MHHGARGRRRAQGGSGGLPQDLDQRLSAVRERIAAAAARAGRPSADIRLMAVTKTHPRAVADAAVAAGIRLLGENRVQEAAAKLDPRPAGIELHLIGHLQRNKARAAAALFDAVQSIDKLETAAALQKALAGSERTVDVLLELNTTGEAAKHGVRDEDQLTALAEQLAALDRLRLRGVMTMAMHDGDTTAIRGCFRRLQALYERLCAAGHRLDTLSMGMTGDFEIAIEEGSTLVRIGTALFGPRPAP